MLADHGVSRNKTVHHFWIPRQGVSGMAELPPCKSPGRSKQGDIPPPSTLKCNHGEPAGFVLARRAQRSEPAFHFPSSPALPSRHLKFHSLAVSVNDDISLKLCAGRERFL